MRRITMRHGMTGARLRSPLRCLREARQLAGSLPRPIATRRHMSPAPCCSACQAAHCFASSAAPCGGRGGSCATQRAARSCGNHRKTGCKPVFLWQVRWPYANASGSKLLSVGCAKPPYGEPAQPTLKAEVQMIFATVVAKIFIGYTCQKQGG